MGFAAHQSIDGAQLTDSVGGAQQRCGTHSRIAIGRESSVQFIDTTNPLHSF
jgi:hypothetical protein